MRRGVCKESGAPAVPPPHAVRWGDLRRLQPFCSRFGAERGTPIGRWFVERFLAEQAGDIRGVVLEVGDATYTRRFGRDVTHSDVLHAAPGNPRATLVGDLASDRGLPRDRYDCVILTHVLSCIFDLPAALAQAHRRLRVGGVLLATLPGITRVSRYDQERWGDYWRCTAAALRRLIETAFGSGHYRVCAYGNVLTAAAALYGIAAEELRAAELEYADPDFEQVLAVRAVRSK
jgi:SAM-dependent methyltransferase